MATDLTIRTCSSCAHAAICPNREAFMAFYNHRDEVMVKCGDGTGNLDDTQAVTVRIEHRYLDGPGLEQLYRELGLGNGFGCNPCMWANGCPLNGWKHPYDTPIYMPYPHAAGYIAPLCQGARTPNGDRIQFIAPVAPPATNQVHASPYPPFSTKYTSCSDCPNLNNDKVDYAKLGGTVYSTFDVTNLDTEIDKVINLADIPTPTSIMAGYQRAESNPETFTVTSEENIFIIYYTYGTSSTTPIPDPIPDAMSEDEIKSAGLNRKLEIFYGEESYFIGSNLKSSANSMQNLYCTGIIAGIPRYNGPGDISISYGSRMMCRTDGDGYIRNVHMLGASDYKYMIGTTTAATHNPLAVMEAAESDTIQLVIEHHKDWKLDEDALKRQVAPYAEIEIATAFASSSDRAAESIFITFGETDVHMALQFIHRAYYDNSAYTKINYDTWDPAKLYLSMATMKGELAGTEYIALKPETLRVFNDKSIDSPSYDTQAPDTKIVSTLYGRMRGYSLNASARKQYSSNLGDIMAPENVESPTEIRFLSTGEVAPHVYWAMWGLNESALATVFGEKFSEFYTGSFSSPEIGVSTLCTRTKSLTATYAVRNGKIDLNYEPSALRKLIDTKTAEMAEVGIDLTFFILPDDYQSFDLINQYPTSENDSGSGKIPAGMLHVSGDESLHSISQYMVMDSTKIPDTIGKVVHLLIVAQPKNILGFAYNEQNFIAYNAEVQMFQKELKLTLIFDGSEMNPSFGYDASKMKGYELSGVAPEDMDAVFISISDTNVIELTGDKAQYYKLANTLDIKYQEDVTCKVYRPGCTTDPEVSTFAVPYRYATDISFASTQLCSVKSITVDGATLFEIIEEEVANKVTHRESFATLTFDTFNASCERKDNDIIVHLSNVGKDLEVIVEYQEGSQGVSAVCERCADYVETAPYKFMEWVPLCNDYAAGSNS